MKRLILSIICISLTITTLSAQKQSETIVPIKYGDMESWATRYIKESWLLGGDTKTLYVCGPKETIKGNKAYDFNKTIWGISNAYANVMGVAKAVCTTQPEKRGNGLCARLDTRMVEVKVIGMINIELAVAGTLFLGGVNEPVKGANDPYASINMGIPFTKRPKALLADIKARVSPVNTLTKATGINTKKIVGHDEPEIYIFLQKRWEDKDGNIHAKRIGTARHRFNKSIPEWHNDYRININYGDITKEPFFKKYMGLSPDGEQFKAKNSKGEMKLINEIGWADPNEQPTHIILMITAGCYPAFYGAIGNAFWVDNLRFVY